MYMRNFLPLAELALSNEETLLWINSAAKQYKD